MTLGRCAASRGGYAWWYAEVSDGEYVLTVILFAGAVFSPWYAARAGDTGLDHPAINMVLYRRAGGGGRRQRQVAWVMNEHPARALGLLPDGVRIGKSRLTEGADGGVRIEVEEETTRFFGKPGPVLRARVVLTPEGPPVATPDGPLRLSPAGDRAAHYWRPILLRARATVELRLGERSLRFAGQGYHDSNFGSGRLEEAFASWCWGHGVKVAPGASAPAVVLYRTRFLGGGGRGIVVREGPEGGTIETVEVAQAAKEGDGTGRGLLWTRAPASFEAGGLVCTRQPGEAILDAPFYARFPVSIAPSGVRTSGSAWIGVGEYLDLSRFASRAVQFLLRYKIRRINGPGAGAP